jgi:spectrin beta
LINYDRLHPSNPVENLNNAFTVAHKQLGINPLLDAEGKSVRKYKVLLGAFYYFSVHSL